MGILHWCTWCTFTVQMDKMQQEHILLIGHKMVLVFGKEPRAPNPIFENQFGCQQELHLAVFAVNKM